jgi:hypothetical protein
MFSISFTRISAVSFADRAVTAFFVTSTIPTMISAPAMMHPIAMPPIAPGDNPLRLAPVTGIWHAAPVHSGEHAHTTASLLTSMEHAPLLTQSPDAHWRMAHQ